MMSSSTPEPVSAPPPKSADADREDPVTTTSPLASTATALARSVFEPPITRDHRCAPAAVYFATTKSSLPPPMALRGPPPISTVPLTYPATMMQSLPPALSQLARLSTAVPASVSALVPPYRRDH